jgi:hypothetical protein
MSNQPIQIFEHRMRVFQGQKPTASVRPALLVPVSDHDSDSAAIVGLRKFKFVSQGNPGVPDGAVSVFLWPRLLKQNNTIGGHAPNCGGPRHQRKIIQSGLLVRNVSGESSETLSKIRSRFSFLCAVRCS